MPENFSYSLSLCYNPGFIVILDDSMTTLGVAFSTPTVPGKAAELAIDRDKTTCTYLKPKKPRWWRIDLGNVHKVLSVAVTMNSTGNKYYEMYCFLNLKFNSKYACIVNK